VVVSPDRLQLAEKESGFVERVAVRVAEEKAVIFCGREEVKAAEGCGEGECGGGECRSSSRKGKWVRWEGCREGCRGEGFFADEKLIKAAFGCGEEEKVAFGWMWKCGRWLVQTVLKRRKKINVQRR
jgi:hypothetical protein